MVRLRSLALLVLLTFPSACGPAAPPELPVRPPPPVVPRTLGGASPPSAPVARDDDFLYLEEVTGGKALAFAREHNAVSEKELTSDPGFHALESRLFAIFSSKDAIPHPQVANDKIRNFWTDADNPRGLWRETTLAEYRKAKPAWTTLLDVDALGKAEKESFVYKGATCLYPKFKKCLVSLSKGGGDAVVIREFDVDKKAFVPDGFVLPEAKSRVSWKDENTLYVGTDFGPGSMTKSGYPRISKEWKRGTPLGSATPIFEGKETDVGAGCSRDWDHGKARDFCSHGLDFERYEFFLLKDGKQIKVEKQDDATFGTWDDEIAIRLRSDWTPAGTTYKKGSLILAKLDAFLQGKRDFQVLFEPTTHTSLASWAGTKSKILVNVLSDVKNQVTIFTRKNGKWASEPLKESASAINVAPYDPHRSDDVWLTVKDFTVPDSLVLMSGTTGKREPMKQNPAFFEAGNLEIAQHFATSKDGTKIPYFEVGRKGRSGASPTLLEAYGGFEISLAPVYMGGAGAAWMERGGVYVQANIRGGGEYGPEWHQAAMKQKRQTAYDDLAAVAEDLVRRGVATSKTLGVMGGSNGGLLTSVMLTQHPELFGAVVSRVPLTDMKRYHKLLAGASWMSEYGDPDDADDWAALAKYSPFHNIRKDAAYPPVFYTTSTKDDRVHPAHARKMVAKLERLGHTPLYYENIEGGHGGAADVKQRAYVSALVFTFLGTRLGLK
jgi:prolyl oligopeptidase